jgi:hypothetical protein
MPVQDRQTYYLSENGLPTALAIEGNSHQRDKRLNKHLMD